jgi:hypothetical protein
MFFVRKWFLVESSISRGLFKLEFLLSFQIEEHFKVVKREMGFQRVDLMGK